MDKEGSAASLEKQELIKLNSLAIKFQTVKREVEGVLSSGEN